MSQNTEASICPITHEAIAHPICLRGAYFDLKSILELLQANGPDAMHPYERTSLTPTELRQIYVDALEKYPAYMIEAGWALPSTFLAYTRGGRDDTSQQTEEQLPSPTQQSCCCCSRISAYELCVCAALLFIGSLIAGSIFRSA